MSKNFVRRKVGKLPSADLRALHDLARSGESDITGRPELSAVSELIDSQPFTRAYFLTLAPGETLPPSEDIGAPRTWLLVVSANDRCRNYWIDEYRECWEHLSSARLYEINRQTLHWMTNGGETTCVHLLLER